MLIAVVAAAIVAIVLTVTNHQPRRDATVSGRAVVVARLALMPTSAQPAAGGIAAVMRAGQKLVLLIQAHGLAPNGQDVYAVWLNTPGGPRDLLGLVSPPVRQSGTFSSEAPLPGDAFRFADLLLTRETTIRPARPGQLILTAPLKPR